MGEEERRRGVPEPRASVIRAEVQPVRDAGGRAVQLRQLFEAIPRGVVLLKPIHDGGDFIVTDINPAGERITGVRAAEAVGRRLTHTFPSGEAVGLLGRLRDTWRTGAPQSVTIVRRGPEHTTVWIENHILRLPSGEVVALYDDVSARVEYDERLRKSREQLRELANRLATLEEAQRRHVARELHDRVGQSLTALSMNLKCIQCDLADGRMPEAAERLDQALGQVRDTTRQVRTVMSELRPHILDDYGLGAALHAHGEEFERMSAIRVSVRADDIEPRLPDTVEMALYRIAQEALSNVAKHARATHVKIRLTATPSGAQLRIADDGVGFDATSGRRAGEQRGWGHLTMRERALSAGGRLEILSREGDGTVVVAEVKRCGDANTCADRG